MPSPFSIQVTIDAEGVQGVRVIGEDWEQPRAYAILERVGPLLKQLDALVRGEAVGEGTESSKGPVQCIRSFAASQQAKRLLQH
jgi:hypothetical protein